MLHLHLNYFFFIISEYFHYNFELNQIYQKYTAITNTGEMGEELNEFMIYSLNIALGIYL